jgi:hypothetical protein
MVIERIEPYGAIVMFFLMIEVVDTEGVVVEWFVRASKERGEEMVAHGCL